MASGFQFSDSVSRVIKEAALSNTEYHEPWLGSPITRKKSIPNSYLISNKVPYHVLVPVGEQGDFRDFRYENGIQPVRLSSVQNEGQIYSFPFSVFLTDHEIALWRMRNFNIKKKAYEVLSIQTARFRIRRWFDELGLVVESNESNPYSGSMTLPSMRIGDGTANFDYDNTLAAERKFSGIYHNAIWGWVVHTDIYDWIRKQADTQMAGGYAGAKWISKDGNRLYMHGIPVYEAPWEDLSTTKNGSAYTSLGLKYTDTNVTPNVDRYRSYLLTKSICEEWIGWAPRTKFVDMPPQPAGTPGWPTEGMSAGIMWHLDLLVADIFSIPKNGWDRLGVVQLHTILPT